MKDFKNLTAATALALLALAGISRTASATAIYTNLAAQSLGSDPLATDGPEANSFSTGSTAVNLTSVELPLRAGNPADGGHVTVGLYVNNGNRPGARLATLGTVDDSSLTTSLATITLSQSVPEGLTANTRYWIELSENSSTAAWSYAATNADVGTAGEYHAARGGTLVYLNTDGNPPYRMEVDVSAASTAAPEPASLTLLLAGMAGLVSASRVSRRHLS